MTVLDDDVTSAAQMALARDRTDGIGSYEKVLTTLDSAIRWLRYAAVAIFAIGGVFIGWALWILPGLTDTGVQKIIENPDNPLVAVFELFRGTAFAVVVASLIFGVLSLGRAALDQATRYQKRLMAANFMHYVLVRYEDQLKNGSIKLEDVVKFMEAWSKNVESAFTNVKFGNAKSQNLRIAIDPKGALSAEQGNEGNSREKNPSTKD